MNTLLCFSIFVIPFTSVLLLYSKFISYEEKDNSSESVNSRGSMDLILKCLKRFRKMSKPAFQPLVNLGGSNFCFMNAIIQVKVVYWHNLQNIWNIKGFRDTLISGSIPHQSSTVCYFFVIEQIMEEVNVLVFTVVFV